MRIVINYGLQLAFCMNIITTIVYHLEKDMSLKAFHYHYSVDMNTHTHTHPFQLRFTGYYGVWCQN